MDTSSGELRLNPMLHLNMVILGDYSVGKTTTLRHIACVKDKTLKDSYCPMSVTTSMNKNGTDVKVKIVDTGGRL